MSKPVSGKLVLVMALLGLVGCETFKGGATSKDPNFRYGYEDGCAAATQQGADLRDRPVGDAKALSRNDMYREGWSTGFHTCRRSDMEPTAAPGDNPVRLPGPGH